MAAQVGSGGGTASRASLCSVSVLSLPAQTCAGAAANRADARLGEWARGRRNAKIRKDGGVRKTSWNWRAAEEKLPGAARGAAPVNAEQRGPARPQPAASGGPAFPERLPRLQAGGWRQHLPSFRTGETVNRNQRSGGSVLFLPSWQRSYVHQCIYKLLVLRTESSLAFVEMLFCLHE